MWRHMTCLRAPVFTLFHCHSILLLRSRFSRLVTIRVYRLVTAFAPGPSTLSLLDAPPSPPAPPAVTLLTIPATAFSPSGCWAPPLPFRGSGGAQQRISKRFRRVSLRHVTGSCYGFPARPFQRRGRSHEHERRARARKRLRPEAITALARIARSRGGRVSGFGFSVGWIFRSGVDREYWSCGVV